jgi:hypothetical protein
MLLLHLPLQTIPVVHDIHLFHNAGYSIHNVPMGPKEKQTNIHNSLFLALSTNIKHNETHIYCQ